MGCAITSKKNQMGIGSGHNNQDYPLLSLDICVSMGLPHGRKTMEWTTPQHEEISLSCEVSSYTNAEL
jgi:hypothetical protein